MIDPDTFPAHGDTAAYTFGEETVICTGAGRPVVQIGIVVRDRATNHAVAQFTDRDLRTRSLHVHLWLAALE